MKNEAISLIYGQAADSLVDHLDFLVTRETGHVAAGWDIVSTDGGVQMIVPVASSTDAKALFEKLNNKLNFRKAVQRTTEAFSHCGITEEQCPALWAAATALMSTAESQ